MRGMQEIRGMFSRIPGNLKGFWHFSIPWNNQEDSEECSRRFQRVLSKIPRDVREDSGECSSNFQRMFEKIPANQNFDLFLEILLVFYQFLLLNCYKVMEKTITQQFFQRKHFLQHFHH